VEIPEVEEVTETTEEIPETVSAEQLYKNNQDKMVRELAKDAGISHWHTKSIKRLTKELKELEDAEQPED
jgi:uncharacterized protein YidB (DUF937 family)